MFNLALRNLKIFFRQKSTVLFSLLGVFIIMGLYLLFLGDAYVGSSPLPGMKSLMDHWLIAGIVSITSITTTMGAFETMVLDRANHRNKDFFSAPISRRTIVGGYILCAYVVGLIMTLLAFVLGELFILTQGGALLSAVGMMQALGVILLSTFMSSSFVFFLVSFFSSSSAFSNASTLLGTLIGFLTGIYIPIGNFPASVQWLIKLFPVAHTSALMRQIMMKEAAAVTFAGVPSEYWQGLQEAIGVVFKFGEWQATPLLHLSVIFFSAVFFFVLAIWNVSRTNG